MIADGAPNKEIKNYIITTKFRTVTGNRNLTEAQALKTAELIDEVSPKSAFKELDAELRRSGAAKKRK